MSLNLTAVDRVYPVFIPAQNILAGSDGDEEQDCITYSSEGITWDDPLTGRVSVVRQQFRLRFFSSDFGVVRSMEREYVDEMDRHRGGIGSNVEVQDIGFTAVGVDGWEPDKQLFVRESVLVVTYAV